jgi:hypothetical protein
MARFLPHFTLQIGGGSVMRVNDLEGTGDRVLGLEGMVGRNNEGDEVNRSGADKNIRLMTLILVVSV